MLGERGAAYLKVGYLYDMNEAETHIHKSANSHLPSVHLMDFGEVSQCIGFLNRIASDIMSGVQLSSVSRSVHYIYKHINIYICTHTYTRDHSVLFDTLYNERYPLVICTRIILGTEVNRYFGHRFLFCLV